MADHTLEIALDQFKEEMLEKFKARDAKQKERSVTRVGAKHLNDPGIRAGLYNHLADEGIELLESNLSDPMEAVDVANMAFLIWWSIKEESK